MLIFDDVINLEVFIGFLKWMMSDPTHALSDSRQHIGLAALQHLQIFTHMGRNGRPGWKQCKDSLWVMMAVQWYGDLSALCTA